MPGVKGQGALDWGRLAAVLLVVAIHTSPLSSLNSEADFILTRVLARLAVPFFMLLTGYFVLAPYLADKERGWPRLRGFWQKTALLYGLAALLYLPVNLYAGHFAGRGPGGLLRLCLLEGSFYHLWYLPAVMLGLLLICLLSRWLTFKQLAALALLLYLAGLPGDSYYGLLALCPGLQCVYDHLLAVFAYTRNGVFYAPVFLLMGAYLRRSQPAGGWRAGGGWLFWLGVLLAEGWSLHYWQWQRHDSMYIALLPCMFYLFRCLLLLDIAPAAWLRQLTAAVYILHPWCVILVRGAAKLTGWRVWLVENSMLHYLAVCGLSFLLAGLLVWLAGRLSPPAAAGGRAWLEISREELRHNLTVLQQQLSPGCQLLPVVKANAYGHGASLLAGELNRLGYRAMAVATAAEGQALRRGGIKGEILVLGYTPPEQLPLLRRYRLTQTVLDYEYARLLSDYGHRLRVQLKIDTGMHRLGEDWRQLERLQAICSCPGLRVVGAFSHLAAADSQEPADREYTLAQAAAFRQTVAALQARGCPCGRLHLLASYGLLNYPEIGGDYARVGIALYGVLSSRGDLAACPVELRPVLSLKARVALVRDLPAGESAGYGRQYVAADSRKIAVLPLGYADGVPRGLAQSGGRVLLRGQFAPVVGRICMDQLLIDVTEIPAAAAGDVAVVIGSQGGRSISVYDWAEATGTITNEILSRLGSRLERKLT